MKRTIFIAVLLGFLSSYAYPLEKGKANGSMRVSDKVVKQLEFSGARLQESILFDNETDIVLFASDKPVVVEDLEDDTVAHEAGHVAVYFIKREADSYSVHMGESAWGGTREAVKFDGTLSDGSVVGRIYTTGVQTLSTGEKIEFDVQVNAPIHSIIQKPFTAAESSAAARSELMKLYNAFLAAKDADSIAPTLSAGMAAKLENLDDDVSLLKRGHKVGKITPKHVTVDGDKAILYLEAPGKAGNVRFVREKEGWKVSKEAWRVQW